jgi:predicted dienelactone hydrolase
MRGFASFILLVACWASNALAQSVGFDQVLLYADSDRPLKASVWYPSQTQIPQERIAENAVFVGTDVVRLGTPSQGEFPVVILSHGYGGNWRNENWLATRLVQDGYIVAALDHPGTTTFDHSPLAASQWWRRATDVSRLLDWLLEQSYLVKHIDDANITAIGHSLGGWTVMLLAGAEFDRNQLKQECEIYNNPRTCGLMTELGMDQPQIGEPANGLTDARIKRVVTLDLGLARSLSRQSLQVLTTPTLILAAGVDIGDLPQEKESGFLAQFIPKQNRDYIVYPDAAHFSFMQLCKPNAIAMLEEEVPGDGIICRDGDWRSREKLHQAMYLDIIHFLQAS